MFVYFHYDFRMLTSALSQVGLGNKFGLNISLLEEYLNIVSKLISQSTIGNEYTDAALEKLNYKDIIYSVRGPPYNNLVLSVRTKSNCVITPFWNCKDKGCSTFPYHSCNMV